MTAYLLDTQIVIWGALEPRRLSATVREIIQRTQDVFVSAVTIWEIETKRQIGKLRIDVDLEDHLHRSGFQELPITWAHARQVSLLPMIHRDPFDRILAAQAISENLVLVTADRELARYPIRTTF